MIGPKEAATPATPSGGQGLPAERLIDLMRRYQRADEAAADELVSLLGPLLARYYYALTGNPRLVEDLLQECWLRIHRARASYRVGEPVLPWVLAIARHTRVDQFRRWQRTSGRESTIESLAIHPSVDPRSAMEARLEARAILAAVETLPESQREVLVMMKMGGLSVEDVARATGSTAAAVKQKAYRAYQGVRRALGWKGKQEETADDLQRD